MLTKCSYLELLLSLISQIRTECREIRIISYYSVRMRENTDQEYSECGRFPRSDYCLLHFSLPTKQINLKSGISIMNNVTLLLQVLNTGEHMSEATSGAFL